jgi:hypothetical protein
VRTLLLLVLLSGEAHARPPRGLEIAGGVLLAVSYLASLSLAIHYQQPELALPVLGPLVDLRRCDRCTGSPAEDAIISGLVADAALQTAGVALLWSGLVVHRKREPNLVFQAPFTLHF